MQNGFKTYCPHQSINKRWFCNIEFYSRELVLSALSFENILFNFGEENEKKLE